MANRTNSIEMTIHEKFFSFFFSQEANYNQKRLVLF